MKNSKRIIVVEDDVAIRDVIATIFERRGYEVVAFEDADSLLHAGGRDVQLFKLDKQLPGMDGLDLCRHLKGEEATQHIPVIMLSASPQMRTSVMKAGADDFLEKPFQMQALRSIAERFLLAG